MLASRSGLFSSAVFMSVSMYPGAMALTVMPFDVHSFAKLFVTWPTAPLEAAYAGTVRPPWKVSSEAKLMMLPRRPVAGDGSRWSMCAPKSRQRVKTALRFTCMTWKCQHGSAELRKMVMYLVEVAVGKLFAWMSPLDTGTRNQNSNLMPIS